MEHINAFDIKSVKDQIILMEKIESLANKLKINKKQLAHYCGITTNGLYMRMIDGSKTKWRGKTLKQMIDMRYALINNDLSKFNLTTYIEWANFFKKKLAENGLNNIEAFCKTINKYVDRSDFNNWKRGEAIPGPAIRKLTANAFNIELDDFELLCMSDDDLHKLKNRPIEKIKNNNGKKIELQSMPFDKSKLTEFCIMLDKIFDDLQNFSHDGLKTKIRLLHKYMEKYFLEYLTH